MNLQAASLITRALSGTPAGKAGETAPPPRLLVSASEAAAMLGVALRTFHGMRDRLPKPVNLSRTCVRWRVSELAEWAQSLQGYDGAEPAQLRAGKMQKRAPAGGLTGGNAGEIGAEQALARGLTEQGSVALAAEAHSA